MLLLLVTSGAGGETAKIKLEIIDLERLRETGLNRQEYFVSRIATDQPCLVLCAESEQHVHLVSARVRVCILQNPWRLSIARWREA